MDTDPQKDQGQTPSEYWLEKANDALVTEPPDYSKAFRYASYARFVCESCFPTGALKQLYLGIRWELSALDHQHVRDWSKALDDIAITCNAYRLVRRRGEGTWMASAAERGLQRCMEIGMRILESRSVP